MTPLPYPPGPFMAYAAFFATIALASIA